MLLPDGGKHMNTHSRACACPYVCACLRVCICACVRVRVRAPRGRVQLELAAEMMTGVARLVLVDPNEDLNLYVRACGCVGGWVLWRGP
jgi:hypothetical protein